MSFILDALKKSELERQRQLVPGLVDPARAPVRTRLPVWAVALGILLAINLGVLSYVLLRQAPSAPSGTPNRVVAASPAAGVPLTAPGPVANTAAMPTTAATPAAAATSAAAPANAVPSGTADHFSPMDGAPTYAPEIPLADEARPPTLEEQPAERRGAAAGKAAAGTAPSGSGTSVRAAGRTTVPAAEPDDEEVLPSIAELNLSGPEALPELHLDVHVYATNPADRFIYVNGRKYHEGAHMQEGPLVEHIRRDGVVLNYRGIRFLLPRE